MHRYPPNPSQMQGHPPHPAPPSQYPSEGPPSQPYPPYPPPHDARRSNSPYVHPQGIPLPPTTQDPAAAQQPQSQSSESTTSTRPSRKRKLQSPAPEQQQQPHQLPPPPPPPPHAQYEAYYAQPHQPVDSQGNPVPPLPTANTSPDASPSQPSSNAPGGRQLSTSKRAEQNRKAQRAFRERRDAHVKALESRSQLLDTALASADEANRRWEECRALVDQLRVENAALRAALGAAHAPPAPPTDATQKTMENGTAQHSRAPSVEQDGDD
ncbi:hypothetical protein JB92DRAFT_1166529 [Gautieria morchelliformis]|nr:hypothetical protein JB92DRAFT_1166529 [Gautieria morchelliformis]